MTPKGGRGKRANYATVQVRCPEPLKPKVQELIQQFHENQGDLPLTSGKPPAAMTDEEIAALLHELGKEYLSRIPKTQSEQAEEISDHIIQKMEALEFTPDMQRELVAKILEKYFNR